MDQRYHSDGVRFYLGRAAVLCDLRPELVRCYFFWHDAVRDLKDLPDSDEGAIDA